MFAKNDTHRQMSFTDTVAQLPETVQRRLDDSWAGTFYREFFCRIDETPYAVLYSTKPSRPNIPVNELIALETLKAGFGWSDEELLDHYWFDLQTRYALGRKDLASGGVCQRTLYYFRERLLTHLTDTGENLLEATFEQVTDAQAQHWEVQTRELRMDSTPVMSNIRTYTRLRLLVEVVQRVWRMLTAAEQEHYSALLGDYLQGSAGQYLYRVKSTDYTTHIAQIGGVMQQLVAELAPAYAEHATYQMLQRVFGEHFQVHAAQVQVKSGDELRADSLQSPDDPDATYREKRGEGQTGYSANVTETCAETNPLQLIVKVQVAPNCTDDAALLADELPDLKARTDVQQLFTDGGYNSENVDQVMRTEKVQLIQTAIRGRQPAADKLGCADFTWELDAEGQPEWVTCPAKQRVSVTPGRKAGRFRAAFASSTCATCPLRDRCPAKPLQRKPLYVLNFSQHDVDLALRRQRCAALLASGHNPRAAVEATVGALKHPFRHGKVPVRGRHRVHMLLLGSAVLYNVRQIHRHLTTKNATAAPNNQNVTDVVTAAPIFRRFQHSLALLTPLFQLLLKPRSARASYTRPLRASWLVL